MPCQTGQSRRSSWTPRWERRRLNRSRIRIGKYSFGYAMYLIFSPYRHPEAGRPGLATVRHRFCPTVTSRNAFSDTCELLQHAQRHCHHARCIFLVSHGHVIMSVVWKETKMHDLAFASSSIARKTYKSLLDLPGHAPFCTASFLPWCVNLCRCWRFAWYTCELRKPISG